MITERRLRHLLALVKHAHFGRAARVLGISQPALTQSIQALEAELGVKLVDRQRGAITLTVFGDLVAERVRSLLSQETDLRREIALLAGLETGSLKIALGPYPSVISGYAGTARLLTRHPKIDIAVRVTGWRNVLDHVRARAADIGIAELGGLHGNEEFATELIGQHPGRFFCRPGHRILESPQVSLPQLLEFPWVTTRLPLRVAGNLPPSLGAAGKIDALNGDFVPAIEIDVPIQLAGFLAGSDALIIASLTIMERELLAGDVVLVPATLPDLRAGYGFIYLKNRSLAPAALAYMQEVRAVEADIVKREAVLAERFADSSRKNSKKRGAGKR